MRHAYLTIGILTCLLAGAEPSFAQRSCSGSSCSNNAAAARSAAADEARRQAQISAARAAAAERKRAEAAAARAPRHNHGSEMPKKERVRYIPPQTPKLGGIRG